MEKVSYSVLREHIHVFVLVINYQDLISLQASHVLVKAVFRFCIVALIYAMGEVVSASIQQLNNRF